MISEPTHLVPSEQKPSYQGLTYRSFKVHRSRHRSNSFAKICLPLPENKPLETENRNHRPYPCAYACAMPNALQRLSSQRQNRSCAEKRLQRLTPVSKSAAYGLRTYQGMAEERSFSRQHAFLHAAPVSDRACCFHLTYKNKRSLSGAFGQYHILLIENRSGRRLCAGGITGPSGCKKQP